MTAMVKTFGAVLIIGATSLWGIRAADRINDQYVQMQYLKKLINQLRSEIRYARSYLGEAFRHIGTSSREPYKGWILEIYDRLEHKNRGTLADIWEDTVREYLGASGLPDEELDKLINLGGQLGVADIEMQVKTLDLYLEEMSLSMEEMRGGMKAKVRLCHCLGVMSGIFITVLLI